MSGNKTIAIVSSCGAKWGGSEELWARSIPGFLQEGYKVAVLKSEIDTAQPEFRTLHQAGIELIPLRPARPDSRAMRLAQRAWRRTLREFTGKAPRNTGRFELELKRLRPAMVVISQGINFDGLEYGYACLEMGIPYVLLSQKATDVHWPQYTMKAFMSAVLKSAATCFFVSRHNKRLTEEQFGMRLDNGAVVYNPVKLQRRIIPYPDTTNEFRLACIARLELKEKGQDMIIRIMARPEWRERHVRISFFGSGRDEAALKDMARLYDLKNLHFEGFTNDVAQVWEQHHALILPSRCEGMPLVLLEAMAVGRIGIITNAGGNAEIVEDNENAFVGTACEEGVAEALERAWQQRDRWEEMGRAAYAYINAHVPAQPELEFSEAIIKLMS